MPFLTLLLLLAIVATFFLGKTAISKLVDRIGRERAIALPRIQYVKFVLLSTWALLGFISGGLVIGIGYNDVGLFFGSMFAVIGVALFAQWSILSNITASIIVFFFFPYRVGDYIKILDGENSFEGVIHEITLFHVIVTESEDVITTYPNAMVFQKAVKIKREPAHSHEPVQKPADTHPAKHSDDEKV